MLKMLKNRKGVTLVELLAVVVILGIIAAIAVPTIGNLISNQQEKADEATLQNVIAAAKTYYAAENDDIFTIDDMGSYIDMGDNTFTTTDDGVTTIYIKVSGNTVSFHSAEAADSTNYLVNITINDTEFTLTSGSNPEIPAA